MAKRQKGADRKRKAEKKKDVKEQRLAETEGREEGPGESDAGIQKRVRHTVQCTEKSFSP